ncbi:MAG: iron donor protein CyaY [Archangium sp.]|nr:iron donor protein CyaY [Archangium sp.]MDP3571611.1 iron donor protein CyaY [Archangium sp.]
MDASSYTASVSSFFKRLVAAVDAVDPDLVECDATGDMVTITASKTGTKVIVNTQKAVHQIWVAGKSAGVHFSRADDGRWMDDKGKGLELGQWVAECVKDAAGVSIKV